MIPKDHMQSYISKEIEKNIKDINEINEYVKAVLNGVGNGVMGVVHTIAHPLDDIVYPISELVYDAAIIAAAQEFDKTVFENMPAPEFHNLKSMVSKDSQMYLDAAKRMQTRIDNVANTYKDFSSATGPKKVEMLASLATSILVPGYFLKAVKVATNLYKFDIPHNPPKFETYTENMGHIFPTIKNFRKDDLRKTPYQGELLYVITEEGELIITPRNYHDIIYRETVNSKKIVPTKFIIHPEMNKMQPVVSAGSIELTQGIATNVNGKWEVSGRKIKKIMNRSGHFVPVGEDVGKITVRTFQRNGFGEVSSATYSPIQNPPPWPPKIKPGEKIGYKPSPEGIIFGSTIGVNSMDKEYDFDLSFIDSLPSFIAEAHAKSSRSGKFEESSFASEKQAKESFDNSILKIKKIIHKSSTSSDEELIKNVKEIESAMEELKSKKLINDHLTETELNQLNKMLEGVLRISNQQLIHKVESFVDDVNTVFDKNYFSHKYKPQHSSHQSSGTEKLDPIPILHSAFNIYSFINENESYRVAAKIISGTQMLKGGTEILSAFSEQGISALFSSAFSIGSGNFLSGFGNLLKLFGSQKNPNAPLMKMLQGISNQIARLHQDVLEGFRQVLSALGLIDLKMAYGFQKLELLANQKHEECMTTLQNIQKFLHLDRTYLQGLSESVKRIELGLGLSEVDKEDWSQELSKIKANLALYKDEGINRKVFYQSLSELMELLHQSRARAVNRAKKINIHLSSYNDLSRALSVTSHSLGSENSGRFKEVSLANRFRSLGEQHLNLILNYVNVHYRGVASLSKKLDAIQNPKQALYPIEQFNPIALSEITTEINNLISLYKKGVFCPKKLTGEQSRHMPDQDEFQESSNCRLNKIEVLERLKLIQGYYKNYDKVLELFSAPELIKDLFSDYLASLKAFSNHAEKALREKMQHTYSDDMQGYYARLEQLSLDLQMQLQQSSSLEIGTHLSCPYPSLGTTFGTFSNFEWVGIWEYGWRGAGWGMTCGNWAPCGSYYPPGTLIDISKNRYINERRQGYQSEVKKQIEQVETLKQTKNSDSMSQCYGMYFSTNLTTQNITSELSQCNPSILYAYPTESTIKLLNGKKIILPITPEIFNQIPAEIRQSPLPGYSWIEFQYEIREGNTLHLTGTWKNTISMSVPKIIFGQRPVPIKIFNWASSISIQPPFGLEEGLIYHWFGGDKPTGQCEEYDEALKRSSYRGDIAARDHYYDKINNVGQDWPNGNLVYTGGPGPGEQWMRLLFMRPSSAKTPGILDSGNSTHAQGHDPLSHANPEDSVKVIQKANAYLSEKRISFFKEYLMNLLAPDTVLASSLSRDEIEARDSLIELDVKGKILNAITALITDFSDINLDIGLMRVFDKESIIYHLNRYNGTLLTLFDQIKLNQEQIVALAAKITQNLKKNQSPKIVHPLVKSSKATLDELIVEVEDNTITPLEEAIYPETEKEIIENLNPLAKTMASLQMASEMVQRNPEKLSYLGPMLQHSHKMIADALRPHGYMLDEPEDVIVSEEIENEEEFPQIRVSRTDKSADKVEETSQTFFGIPMANAATITESPTPMPFLFLKEKPVQHKRNRFNIRPLPLDEKEIQDFRMDFDSIGPGKCGSGKKIAITNAETGASVLKMEGSVSHSIEAGKSLIFVGPNSRATITGLSSRDKIFLPASDHHDGLPSCEDTPQGAVLKSENVNIILETDSRCDSVLPRITPVSQASQMESMKAAMDFIKTPFFHSSLFCHGLAFIAAFRAEIADKILLHFANGDDKRYQSWQKALNEFREKNAVKLVSDLSEMAVRVVVSKDLQVTENTTHIAKDFMQALKSTKKEPRVYLGLLARAFDEAAFLLDKAIPYVSISGLTQILTRTYDQYVASGSKAKAAHTLIDNLPLLIPGSRLLLDSLAKQDKYLNKNTKQASESVIELGIVKPSVGLRRRKS